jgi:orotate phosphoribosyltransferase
VSEPVASGFSSLAVQLARAGLIQFGRFVQPDGAIWPVAAHLGWLPSYPALLRDVAASLGALLEGIAANRLLTTANAIPLGVALSLHTELPMVYVVGEVRDYTAAFAIEGAYDVGHPTVLLSDLLIGAAQAKAITALAKRVGLEVHAILSVLDLGLGAREALTAAGYTLRSALTLREALPLLEEQGFLVPLMRTTVENWMESAGGGGSTLQSPMTGGDTA